MQQEIVDELEGYQKIIDGCRQVVDNYKPTIDIDPSWEMVELGKLFTSVKNGKNVSQVDTEGTYRVSRIQTISHEFIDIEKTKWTNDPVDDKDFLVPNDILLSHINSLEHIGKTAIFDVDVPMVHGVNLLRMRVNEELLLPYFALFHFKSDIFRERVRELSNRAVNQCSISTATLKTIRIPCPTLSEQGEIVEQIQKINELVVSNQKLIDIYTPKIQDRIGKVWGE